MYTCPNCGNTDKSLMLDNGERRHSPDYTLCCVKRLPHAESVAGQAGVKCTNADGLTECGEQWEPNWQD